MPSKTPLVPHLQHRHRYPELKRRREIRHAHRAGSAHKRGPSHPPERARSTRVHGRVWNRAQEWASARGSVRGHYRSERYESWLPLELLAEERGTVQVFELTAGEFSQQSDPFGVNKQDFCKVEPESLRLGQPLFAFSTQFIHPRSDQPALQS